MDKLVINLLYNPYTPYPSDKCTVCEGTGRGLQTEQMECPCNAARDCPNCDGSGWFDVEYQAECTACEGQGTREAQLALEEQERSVWLLHTRYGTPRPDSIRDWWMK